VITIAEQLQQQGRLDGLCKGVQKADIRIARNLLESGMD